MVSLFFFPLFTSGECVKKKAQRGNWGKKKKTRNSERQKGKKKWKNREKGRRFQKTKSHFLYLTFSLNRSFQQLGWKRFESYLSVCWHLVHGDIYVWMRTHNEDNILTFMWPLPTRLLFDWTCNFWKVIEAYSLTSIIRTYSLLGMTIWVLLVQRTLSSFSTL